MIDQVLQEIKLAEEKAASIRAEADGFKAEKAVQQEEDCTKILSDAQKRAKEIRLEAKQGALKDADAMYDEAMALANGGVQALLKEAQPKIEELSAWLLEKVLNGNC